MCDYSTTHLNQTKARTRQEYVADVAHLGYHGFMTADSYRGCITAACVSDGQTLRLANLRWNAVLNHLKLPKACTATVVQRNKHQYDPKYVSVFQQYPAWNDFVLVGEKLVPVAFVLKARMTVAPKVRRKSLAETLKLDTATLKGVALDEAEAKAHAKA